MFTVPDDTPNKRFQIKITGGIDSENRPVPANELSLDAPVSTDDLGVAIAEWNPTADAPAGEGEFKFGSNNDDGTPRLVSVSANVRDKNTNEIVGLVAAQIAVAHGAIIGVSSNFTIDDLTES